MTRNTRISAASTSGPSSSPSARASALQRRELPRAGVAVRKRPGAAAGADRLVAAKTDGAREFVHARQREAARDRAARARAA